MDIEQLKRFAEVVSIPWLLQLIAVGFAVSRRRAGKQQLITSYIVILLPLIIATLATGGMFLFYAFGWLFSNDQSNSLFVLIFILPTIVAAFILPFIKIKY